MIPVKLILEGIYSYRERQTIDFTRLTGAKLFGIFGPVGSGKSTILEAMIYVLYGTIDRLNTEVKYNLMNLQADRLFVDFEFVAGTEGRRYRASVESKRNRKNFTDVSSPKFNYYFEEKGEWQPFTREGLIGIIGLTVQNFKRVVIIPQGKFQDFLMLRDKERTEMMMELFGDLRQYDLSESVTTLETETRQQVTDFRGRIVGLGEVAPETIQEKREKREELKTEEERLKGEIREILSREEKLKTTKLLLDELAVKKETERQLVDMQPEMERLQAELTEYEFCLQHFQQPVGNLEDLQHRSGQVSFALENLRKIGEEKKEILLSFMKNFEVLQERYGEKEEIRKRMERVDAFIRRLEVERECRDLEGRKAKGEEIVVKTRQEIDKRQEELKREKKELEELIRVTPDMRVLSDIREWFSVRQHLLTDREKSGKEKKKIEKEKEELIGEYIALRKKYTVIRHLDKVEGEVWLKVCREQTESVAERLKFLRKEALRLGTRECLATFAMELSEGTPCPLCGALSHPYPLRAEAVEGDVKENTDLIVQLENEEKELSVLISRLTLLNERYRVCREREDQLEAAMKETEEAMKKHSDLFGWKTYSPECPEKVEEEMKRAAELKVRRERREDRIARIGEQIELQRENLEKYRLRLDEIDRLLAQRRAQVELLAVQIEGLDTKRYESYGLEQLNKVLTEGNRELEKLEKDYAGAVEKRREMELENRKLEGNIEEKEREFIRLRGEEESVRKQLSSLLKDTDYSGIEPVKEVLKKKIHIQESHEKINRYNQQLHAVRLRRIELENLLKGVVYDEDQYMTLQKEISAKQFRERELVAESGALDNHISDLEKRYASLLEIRKELTVLEERLQNLQLLKGLFRGNDFVKFVSSIYLQNLCNAANERFFRMTRQRLKLELSEDNDFLVRDLMNEGRTRSARTLSGGQIFQASLSLALALTDNIRHLSGIKQNFFFLDEGFGSLDKESLSIVFDTLKALRDENRIVGLISHVEEMQQEVPACIQVENTSERGTIVTQK
ncbi:AAA family ATPase [Gabonibacter chumensis]|uniref:AAA family ATPase n=1 Tax=Gabonibacter chumensis TaxID=2972474 RepID=UPI002574701D|nr:SbcC/MukB-like Walker B domain-containing protein [Gabonibacter chumensis]MCR9012272.1 AAA family ATPase [Gabonibacter chumensis]